jgi:hypothetical protein
MVGFAALTTTLRIFMTGDVYRAGQIPCARSAISFRQQLKFKHRHRLCEGVLHTWHFCVRRGIRQSLVRQTVTDSDLLIRRQFREQICQYRMQRCNPACHFVKFIHRAVLMIVVNLIIGSRQVSTGFKKMHDALNADRMTIILIKERDWI